ncbi:MAG: VCBS repeat-containing protein [Planctomycetes bacterium]|jgi:hypothetical protein|nr:VCBS repeat-containing protein [Planctomycetota bacterium]
MRFFPHNLAAGLSLLPFFLGTPSIAPAQTQVFGLVGIEANQLVGIATAYDGDVIDGWVVDRRNNHIGPVGDFDGDGSMEVVIRSPWGIGVIGHDGTRLRTELGYSHGTWFGAWNFSATDVIHGAGDFNGDGRDEIIITSSWGMTVLRLQAGGPVPLVIHANSASGTWGSWSSNGTPRIRLIADTDGDNKAEILVSDNLGMGLIGMNTSGALVSNSPKFFYGNYILGWSLSPLDSLTSVGDMNGDGRDDILFQSGWGISVKSIGYSNLDIGGGAFGSWFGGWVIGNDNSILSGDIDGDGKSELMLKSPWGIGSLGSVPGTLTMESGLYLGALGLTDTGIQMLGDLDLDNRSEVLMSLSAFGFNLYATLEASGSAFAVNDLFINPTDRGSWLFDPPNRFTVVGGNGHFIPGRFGKEALVVSFSTPW